MLQTSIVGHADSLSNSPSSSKNEINSCDKLLNNISSNDFERTVSVENNTEIIKVTNVNLVEKFVNESNFEKPSGRTPTEITFVRPLSQVENKSNSLQDLAPGSYYVKNRSSTAACGSSILKKISGNSGSLTLSFSGKVSATWSANAGITASAVSAGVGFNVSAEYSVTQSNTIDTNGRYAEIRAYAEYTGYHFEVWENGWFSDSKVGNGTALRPVGICFVTYR
ncbi:hypothetical protein QUF93_00370 [Bacillus hominis]|uniref:hypothetical protein n=1 Tax=Bacillus hominis TaxID=2817478 RepID=UPI0025A0614C|nr:hypothetical protein [Bacillus hominis]MDM5191183.1 hypothetical protein [Bacillus hominis]